VLADIIASGTVPVVRLTEVFRQAAESCIPQSTQHYPMLQRNLVYTGVTRGKRLVVLVGQRKALATAVKGAGNGGGGRSSGSG
jgi:hypothetical protein